MSISDPGVEERARRSQGTSCEPIYELVARALRERHRGGGTIIDVGCGTGNLWPYVHDQFDRYVGVDVARYPAFPSAAEFVAANLDQPPVGYPAHSADVVAAVETIEHLENPRALFRELTRLARPGGIVLVTTPNQLSLLSKATLVLKNQFNAFQEPCYPAHLTALLEVDLRRMAAECRLRNVQVIYSGHGRIIGTPWRFPRLLSRLFARALSDNVLLLGINGSGEGAEPER